jgi:hypothetical protein
MTPDLVFQLASMAAVAGWILLLAGPLAPQVTNRVAGFVIPGLLSLGYAAVMLAHWAGAPGGFGSLQDVMALFTDPWIALGGWVHYLAFDLFVGAWAGRTGRARGLPHLALIPCLALTFLFGPVGLILFFAMLATLTLVPAKGAA